jgi:hypothetical protein
MSERAVFTSDAITCRTRVLIADSFRRRSRKASLWTDGANDARVGATGRR